MRFAVRLASLGLSVLILSGVPSAAAQGKQRPAPRSAKAKKAPEPAETPAETKPETKSGAPAGAPEGDVKAAGTSATKEPKKGDQAKVTAVEESAKEEGVKTYKFSAVEIEGRLKSPQIVYFLRRVRAEFEAGMLGHRSFMPELSDSRRSPALK